MLRRVLVASLWLSVAFSFAAANSGAIFSPTTTSHRTTVGASWAALPRGGAAAAAAAASKKKGASPAKTNGKNGACLFLPFTKSDVVRAHGYTSLAIVTAWALETVGVPIPVVGLGETVQGVNLDDPITKFFVRVACSLGVGLSLAEIHESGNASLQKDFLLYHIPLSLSCLLGAQELAKGPLGYALTVIASLFLVLGLVA
jgi:hypothetical protein